MNIKVRASVMVLVPLVGMGVVIAAVIVAFGGMVERLDRTGNEIIQPLGGEAIRPLVAEAEAARRVLAAEREAFRAVVAEKAILSARSDQERATIRRTYQEAASAIGDHVDRAVAGITDARVTELRAAFDQELVTWRQESSKVFDYASKAATLQLARNRSEAGGSSHGGFERMRQALADLSELLGSLAKDRADQALATLAEANKESAAAVEEARSGRDLFVFGVIVIGVLSTLVTVLLARGMIARLASISNRIASEGEVLERRSIELAGGSSATAERAAGISSASEEMSNSISSVATASEQMSVSITTVASNAADMARQVEAFAVDVASIEEGITDAADQATRGSQVVSDAAETTTKTSGAMQRLAEMAAEIGHVSEIIFKIAEQTNLLALNATIEAASAGEAGRGFAVVATEIKELAGQSGKAAGDISARIAEIQASTKEVNGEVQELAEVMNTLDQASVTIAARMDQQRHTIVGLRERIGSVTTAVEATSIAINEIDAGAEHVSRNAGELTIGATEVARGVTEVSAVATHSKVLADDVRRSFEDLLAIAEELRLLAGTSGVAIARLSGALPKAPAQRTA